MAISLSGCNYWSEEARAEREKLQTQRQFAKARNLLDRDANKGILLLEDILKKHPDRADVWDVLAFAYLNSHRDEDAAKAFDYSAKTVFKENYLHAAKAYSKVGDNAASVRCYREYLAAFPQDGAVWHQLAESEFSAHHTFEALEAYLSAIRCSTETPSADIYYTIATLFQVLGNIPQEEHWLRRTLATDARHARALTGLLALALQRRDWDSIDSLLSQIDTLASPPSGSDYLIASARTQLKQWKDLQALIAAQEAQQKSINTWSLEQPPLPPTNTATAPAPAQNTPPTPPSIDI